MTDSCHGSNQTLALKELLNSIDRIAEIKKNSYLFAEGDPVNELYILRSGKVQISKLSPTGKELALRLCKPGDIVGELPMQQENVKYILNAKVLEDGEVAVIQNATLEEKLLQNSKLAVDFLKLMNEYSRRDQTRFRDLVLYGKKGALFSTLIRLANSYGKTQQNGILIDHVITNQELANFCGTSRESVNRMLSDLKQQQIISVNRKYITIHNLEYLKTEINCEDCPVVLCCIH
ncbi:MULTISPECIES: Crp/Fnr family transcriptional regulator [unclassified Virgibacillus]|uniref:Crp/Fnr family transcriptional regulator n=1 Tax=unclassified Virgibacillus TaxID=2620237 RepID=UPI0024DE0965|nr:Crp/Fnr family transcriptional regulator [Virgibacillus sp. LDC-1]